MSDAMPQHRSDSALSIDRRATHALPGQQAGWIATQTVAAALLAVGGVWAVQPTLALTVALGAGVALIAPRRVWAAPLVVALVVSGGLLAEGLRIPAIVGAGAMAGLLAAWLLPWTATWLDHVNGALATAAGASLGLWAAARFLPADLPPVAAAALTAAVTGLVASQGLVPLAMRFDAVTPPSRREIAKALTLQYRPPVQRAVNLYAEAIKRHTPERETRRGLCEVTRWVFRLQITLQELDAELRDIDEDEVAQRIAECEADGVQTDAFTRERRQATAGHLRRLLEHRAALAVERTRTDALVGYALAFLEEARAGLALARRLPGEAAPDRLPEVLQRLRTHAADGDARRRTQREIDRL